MHFSPEDTSTWLPLVKQVIRVAFPGGFQPPIERCEVEQECFIRIPEIIAHYRGRSVDDLERDIRKAIKNDARDYLRLAKRKSRESPFNTAADDFQYSYGKKFLNTNGRRALALPVNGNGDWLASNWIASLPQREDWKEERSAMWASIREGEASREAVPCGDGRSGMTEDDLEIVRGVLTPYQYRVYYCRYLLGWTQELTAAYLHKTREGVASAQLKLNTNLRRAGLPVPKCSA